MPSQGEIDLLQELLVAHRKTLATLLIQQAEHTEAHTPPATVHAIRKARGEIRQIKAELRSWNIFVEDIRIDEIGTTSGASDASTTAEQLLARLSDVPSSSEIATSSPAATHSALSPGAPIYIENFAQGAKHWPVGDSSDANKVMHTSVSDGAYRLELTNIGGYSTGIDSLIPERENFDLETSMRLLNGPQGTIYGINFGLNRQQVYNVVFRKDGSYKFGMWSFVRREPEIIQDWAHPISSNSNDVTTLRLKVAGKKARIYVNGDDVIGEDLPLGQSYSKGRIGIAVTIAKDSTAIIEMLTFKVKLLAT